MKEILIYPVLITLAIYILGYGLAAYLTPKKLSTVLWWLAPWYVIVIISVGLTILSMVGIPLSTSAIPTTIFLLGLTGRAWFFDNIRSFVKWRDIILAMVVLVSIFVNLVPLWKNDKILTTVSLGNNDAIIYATVPEYLQKGTIYARLVGDAHEGEYDYNGINNLIRVGYRWGTPITMGYILEITGLRGYQLTYMFQVLLFAWMLPLTYILFVVLHGKESKLGLLMTTGLTAANSNLLYMLYHNFAGQIFFWGLQLFFWIFACIYLPRAKNDSSWTKTEWIMGVIVTAIFYSYHEGAIFLLAPLCLWLLWSGKWKVALRVASITWLLGSIAVVHSIVFDFEQVKLVNGPIGWELFRAINPFANPIEILGLSSIHTSNPLTWWVAWIGSGIILAITTLGIWKGRAKDLLIAITGFYFLMIAWTTWGQSNFFAYNRVITYILPILIIWFVNGWLHLTSKLKWMTWILSVMIMVMSLFSATKLIRRFTYNHISVDRSLMSLSELAHNQNITEPIYLSEVVEGMGYYWRQIWAEYFLYPQKELVSSANLQKFQGGVVPENALILVSKEPWYKPPKLLFEEMVWENGFYKLGRRCLSDDCLLKHAKQLQTIEFGSTHYDDTILVDGWSTPENDHRWADELEASLVWINEKPDSRTKLKVMATSFIERQTITVYLDKVLLETVALTNNWQDYEIDLPASITTGKHLIRMKFGVLAKPELQSDDKRTLAVDFRRITFESE